MTMSEASVEDRCRSAASVDESLKRLLEENYARFQYAFTEFFINHLVDCSRTFDGDLQELLVLAIIGQVCLRSYLDGVSVANQQDYRAISASRIADVTGIPRETVRRKLRSLSDRGWITQSEDSSWKLTVENGVAAAQESLANLDQRGVKRMACAVSSLKPLFRS
jgi:DNA-binding MarR family transcriptional regulator